ncbi:MAG TPA: hypothetical protein VHD15_04500 [Hyphomicrobiales bacterium]|nr:hypothetical protein [Hyphomicrobiales bacterium]
MSAEPTAPAVYEVRDPRGARHPVRRVPLARRPAHLAGRTLVLINSMPHGSNMEEVIDRAAAMIPVRCPGAAVRRLNRGLNYMDDDAAQRAEIVAAGELVVYFGSPTSALTQVAYGYLAALERDGVASVFIGFDAVAGFGAAARERIGAPIRDVMIPYPVRPNSEAVGTAIEAALDALTRPLTNEEQAIGLSEPPSPPRIACRGDLAAVQHHFAAEGWTDGLPIIPPTEEAVAAMLAGTSHRPDEIVAPSMPPEGWRADVEAVAINAVMAGAAPCHLPILLAAVEAFAGGPSAFNVRSGNSFSYLQLVGGPIAREVGMNGGDNALGPGNRANAVIGRALNLFIRNLGGGRVGTNIANVQGNMAMLSGAFTENEASPWPPFHVSQGFGPEDSTLSLFAGGWSHTGNFMLDGFDLLARSLATFEMPNGAVVLISAARAAQAHLSGLSREDVAETIWRAARLPLGEFRRSAYFDGLITTRIRRDGTWPADYLTRPDGDEVPVFPRGTIAVAVVGGLSAPVMQGWKAAHQSSVSIDRWR